MQTGIKITNKKEIKWAARIESLYEINLFIDHILRSVRFRACSVSHSHMVYIIALPHQRLIVQQISI